MLNGEGEFSPALGFFLTNLCFQVFSPAHVETKDAGLDYIHAAVLGYSFFNPVSINPVR